VSFPPFPWATVWARAGAACEDVCVRVCVCAVEGRPIPALTIGGSDSGPAIYFQATLHAREWITTATVLYIAAEMAASEEGSRLRELIRAVRFYVVPVANPDGYVWTWTGPVNRMLRKNRRPDPLGVGGLCDGVDLNRYAGVHTHTHTHIYIYIYIYI
jgi:predicted deacylase